MAYQPKFAFTARSVRVRFGSGELSRLREEIAEIGGQRAVVLTTQSRASLGQEALSVIGQAGVGQFAGAAMHTPVTVTDKACHYIDTCRADCLVSVGGGSTIGLGKAVLKRRPDLAHISVPTTYSGSEMTPVVGETENGRKTTFSRPDLQPCSVIYDPELTLGLATKTSILSGLNAIAHAAEGLYATNRNPLSNLEAVEGIAALVSALPKIAADPANPAARGLAFYGAWLCGRVLGHVSMALHHKLCHVLGGSYNLPHAETHSVLLPHTIAFNEAAVPNMLEPVARIFGTANAFEGLAGFAQTLGAPRNLRELGLNLSDLDTAASLALEATYPNPRSFDRADIRALLGRAWDGENPHM